MEEKNIPNTKYREFHKNELDISDLRIKSKNVN